MQSVFCKYHTILLIAQFGINLVETWNGFITFCAVNPPSYGCSNQFGKFVKKAIVISKK